MEITIHMPDGKKVTLPQAASYADLIEEGDTEGWHFCENGCCMIVHSREHHDEYAWVIQREGKIEKVFADGRVQPYPEVEWRWTWGDQKGRWQSGGEFPVPTEEFEFRPRDGTE